MIKWKFETKELELDFTWKIARGSLNKKTNIFVTCYEENFAGVGEAAFKTAEVVNYQELKVQFDEFISHLETHFSGVEQLTDKLNQSNMPAPLRFAIESAYLHFLSQVSERNVHQLLGVNRLAKAETSFSMPILTIDEAKSFFNSRDLSRFKSLKLKVDKNTDPQYIISVSDMFNGRLRLDANESFKTVEEYMYFERELLHLKNRIDFVEQPLPKDLHEEYFELKFMRTLPLMADESLQDQDVTAYFAERFDAVNIKLQKAGGYLKALRQLRGAKDFKLKTMIGCMVESGLGISSALNIAYGFDYLDLDGSLFLKKDPYPFVVEERGQLLYGELH